MKRSFLILLLLCGGILPVTVASAPANNVFPPKDADKPAGEFPPLNPYSAATSTPPKQATPAVPYDQSVYQVARSYSGYPYLPYRNSYQPFPFSPPRIGYNTPNYQFSQMSPFGNSFSPTSIFNNGSFLTPWSNASLWNPWKNGNNSVMPFFPQQNSDKKKAWGDTRNIWPDFYTDITSEVWDKGINAPYDAGRMPGGWRAPSLSSPDPVTVGDAVINQFPPIMEEMGNMMEFSN